MDNLPAHKLAAAEATICQRGNAVLTTQAIQYNAYLFLRTILLAGFTLNVANNPLRWRLLAITFLSHLVLREIKMNKNPLLAQS
jgi:hypothetical protein